MSGSDQDQHSDALQAAMGSLLPLLADDDDPGMWGAGLHAAMADCADELRGWRGKADIELVVARCSSWRRPHQLRWTAAGGFALPAGYDNAGSGGSHGAPAADWERRFRWERATGRWVPATRAARRALQLRLSLPARSARHEQASLHLHWTPGSPSEPKQQRVTLLGLRRDPDRSWSCVVVEDVRGAAAEL